MFRRIAGIMMLWIYLMSIAGLVLHAHHCGNHLTSLSLYTSAEPCDCGDETDDNCCKDAVIQTARPSVSVVSEKLNVPEPVTVALPGYDLPDHLALLPSMVLPGYSTVMEPPSSVPDVYQLRVLRI